MKNLKIEIKWALIFVLTSLIWMLLERLSGLHSQYIDKHAIYTNLFAVPAILVYVFALRDKRNNFNEGIISYKQGFISGLFITLFVVLINPLSQYIISTIISPDYFANAIAYAVDTGKMTPTEAREYFSLKSYIIQGFIGVPIMGVMTTAIVALLIKRKPAMTS
ncbi:MAG: DUF4199 domain-containing protein [Bacteroidales bacterium]|nr:DUF4199 domain-containing protein [Bacteroidales bacterium]